MTGTYFGVRSGGCIDVSFTTTVDEQNGVITDHEQNTEHQDGVYAYRIEAVSWNLKTIQETGFITVLR